MASGAPASPLAQLRPFLSMWALLPPEYNAAKRAKDVFWYGTDFLPATLSVTTTNAITITNDSDFLWCASYAAVATTGDVAVGTVPPLTIQFTDSGSGRNLMNQAVHIATVAQCALGGPSVAAPTAAASVGPTGMWFPKLLSGGTTLTVAITNLVATSFNVRFVIAGLKIFPMAA